MVPLFSARITVLNHMDLCMAFQGLRHVAAEPIIWLHCLSRTTMGTTKTEMASAPGAAHHEEAISRIREDRLDPHIRDDHGDPHRAALEDLDENRRVTKSTWAAVGFLGFTFQPSLTFTILCCFPILGPIAIELQGNTANANWMASGWSLAGSVAFAIAGQLSDYFGRRWILLFSQALLIIGHIIGASSQSVGQSIGAMVVVGFGTGSSFVLYPGITELLPNKYRPLGLAWTEMNLLPFSTFGPLIARALLQNASWRWVYILGAITGVISFVGTFIFYIPPTKPLRDITRKQLLLELDYVGIALYTLGLTLFLVGLNFGGVSHPWKSAAVLVPMVLGAILFCLTFVWDFLGPVKRPLFPLRLFRNFRDYTFLLVIIFVTGLVYFSMTDIMPEQLSDMFTSDPIRAGLYNIPGGFGGAAGGAIIGSFIDRIKHVHLQLVFGIATQTLFAGLFALITPARLGMTLAFQCFANIPFAWITLCCYVLVLAPVLDQFNLKKFLIIYRTASLNVPQRDLGLALGLVGTFRFLGGAIGTTIFTTILNNKAGTSIPAHVIKVLTPLHVPASQVPTIVTALANSDSAALAKYSTAVVDAAVMGMR
ncbi:putative major facilitator superfamily transporter [Exophiala viscosa]|uniref:putative major facilitator superfamily transporter n=1 Tax=Exophiala viscosa TaxID=2486360 RepID=UPI00219A74AB|nr:putative major facilitator superfamily transporter [Exophiala viscosa]